MKTVKFYTLGCKVNQYETQSIRERFIRGGFEEVLNGRKADVYVINTCTVTHNADKDSRHYINKARAVNPKARIIVTGCIAGKGRDVLSGLKGVDYLISKSFFPDGISEFCGHTRAFLKIQDGCNHFCSYCIVPYVRGRSRSRRLNKVVNEAQKLVNNGFKEIVLTGVCLGAYGKDLKPKVGLTDVIAGLEKINGLLRIRLSSIEPNYVSDELIKLMARSKKLCRHLHIPLQSGDDEVLKKMNRRYSAKDYLRLVAKLKRSIPQIAITTDVLVGFPDEGDKNFKNTLRVVKKILPLKVHIFPYSKREGTLAASKFKEFFDPILVRERVCQLKALADLSALRYKNQFIGKPMDVLFENHLADKPGYWEGLTDNYIRVIHKSKQGLKNKVISLKLKEIYDGAIYSDSY